MVKAASGPESTSPGPVDVVLGDDGRPRCWWGAEPELYRRYHDEEWGVPVRGTTPLFERLSLEAFQSGLSWLTILRKRPAFRAAFAGFDPEQVAGFGGRARDRLMADAGIVRNGRKIDATIHNARAICRMQDSGLDLTELIWSHAPEPSSRPGPGCRSDVPASTPASKALARALKQHGLVFVGPTTAYATMQACGLVDDHLTGCWRSGGD